MIVSVRSPRPARDPSPAAAALIALICMGHLRPEKDPTRTGRVLARSCPAVLSRRHAGLRRSLPRCSDSRHLQLHVLIDTHGIRIRNVFFLFGCQDPMGTVLRSPAGWSPVRQTQDSAFWGHVHGKKAANPQNDRGSAAETVPVLKGLPVFCFRSSLIPRSARRGSPPSPVRCFPRLPAR